VVVVEVVVVVEKQAWPKCDTVLLQVTTDCLA